MVKGFIIFSLVISILACHRQVKFDSKKWKSSNGELILSDIRLGMTEDLIETSILLYKTPNQIDSLLGPSEKEEMSTDDTRIYLVKEVYSSDIDPDEFIYLSIGFDNNGKSKNVELMKRK